MNTNTVNISFRKDLLREIDRIASNESRTRSELIREAARMYIERKNRWKDIFRFGDNQVSKYKLKTSDINREIKKYRNKER